MLASSKCVIANYSPANFLSKRRNHKTKRTMLVKWKRDYTIILLLCCAGALIYDSMPTEKHAVEAAAARICQCYNLKPANILLLKNNGLASPPILWNRESAINK